MFPAPAKAYNIYFNSVLVLAGAWFIKLFLELAKGSTSDSVQYIQFLQESTRLNLSKVIKTTTIAERNGHELSKI